MKRLKGSFSSLTQKNVMLRGQLQLRQHPSHVLTAVREETERIDIHAQIFTVSKAVCVCCMYYVNINHY